MLIGCPKEIKNHEYRVGLTPESAYELTLRGHDVWIESGAGAGIDADDDTYRAVGASIVNGPSQIFAECELVIKVKEPQAEERARLREGQTLFTYLHLAPDEAQTIDLIQSGVTAIAYETVTGKAGQLPLLKPMSQVAGRMSIQAGANALEKSRGGRGILLGGCPGWYLPMWWLSAAAWLASTRRRWPSALARRRPFWTATPMCWNGWLPISRAARLPCLPARRTSKVRSPRRIWWSARCCSPVRRRRSWWTGPC